MQELNLTFVAIDFETTGFPPNGEIIEIGMVKLINKQIIDRYDKLIRPCNQIPEEISLLTGITNEMVCDKPIWKDIAEEVLDFIGDNLLVAHNVDFDKGFLEKALEYKLPNFWVDTWDLAKITLPTLPSYQLKYLVKILDIKENTYHRAISDAEMTSAIFIKLMKNISEKSPFFIEKLLNLLGSENNGLSQILKLILNQKLSTYWNDKRISLKHECVEDTSQSKLLFKFGEAEKIFLPEGLLSSCFNNYEYRPQQIKMLNVIKEAFMDGFHALIEAATGTGKSLAYLIPSLLWAQEKNTKIIISTNTIALQEQLYQVDIPFLEECFNCKLPVSLVKGRNNYLCLRRYNKQLRNSQYLPWREKIFLARIANWLEQTKTGDKEEINLNSHDNELWLELSSQTETCAGKKCSYRNQCYYIKNRKEADKSNLIITNHSLLLLDLKRDNKILPEYDYIIIDEAHNLEDEALKQFAQEVNLKHLINILHKLLKGKKSALLKQIDILLKSNQKLENKEYVFKVMSAIKENGSHLESRINACINYINSQNISHSYELRITEKERNSKWWNNIHAILTDITNYLMSTIHKISSMLNQISLLEEMEELVKELRFLLAALIENYLIIDNFLTGIEEDRVYWLQITSNNLVLIITPFNITDILKEKLFTQKKSVILTSATLAVNNSFSHILNIFGLEKEKVLTHISESPFNYQQQSAVYIPTDLPEPIGISDDVYARYVSETLTQLLPKVYGGILVLFTSYQMLSNVYYALKKENSLMHMEILAHGIDGTRKTLIEALKNKKNRVIIFGTNTFWEGIDVQGIGLTTVVIVKLPFSPPNRPVIAARLESMEKNNENGFYKYSLPTAILKFRQGCGRLIRSRKDWGALIILDKRIISKNYGSKFIKSIPLQPVVISTTKDIENQLSGWMDINIVD